MIASSQLYFSAPGGHTSQPAHTMSNALYALVLARSTNSGFGFGFGIEEEEEINLEKGTRSLSLSIN
jgi:hypothetical protein